MCTDWKLFPNFTFCHLNLNRQDKCNVILSSSKSTEADLKKQSSTEAEGGENTKDNTRYHRQHSTPVARPAVVRIELYLKAYHVSSALHTQERVLLIGQ